MRFATSNGRAATTVIVVSLALGLALASDATAQSAPPSATNVTVDPSHFSALRFRSVGPTRGGRSTVVTGYRDRMHTFLMGAAGGGIWRTVDAGQTWANISDGFLKVGPVGALAVAPSNSNIVYAGTGSGGVRGNVSVGDGIYKTVDDGKTWQNIGLPESRHINRIVVHPTDPDRVWVAALGSVFGPSDDRGVYRTSDGGKTWKKVLFVNSGTGAIELVASPADPNTLYAAMWTTERKPWAIFSGSTAGGVFKTTNGGDSWTKLTNGLPDLIGRIGLDISPARPDRVYVLAEAKGDLRGLYRSEDRGATFKMVGDDPEMMARPWYYTHVNAHPTNPDVVFINNEGFFRSDDGGATLTNIPTPHGDNHGLWINPDHPEIWIQSNDGGANVTFTSGRTWSTQYNQPTGEYYTVTVDSAFPYRLYAPQQDNTTISVPSRTTRGLTPYENWFNGPGCETGPIIVDPRKPNILYGACKGWVTRMDRTLDQEREIWLWPQEGHGLANAEYKFREQWNSQLRFSPNDPKLLYHTSQYVHVSRNEGQSWEIISPDLTRWAEHKQLHVNPPGGPLTYDQTGVEVYSTVFALEESPLKAGLLWAGSDDGAIHLSKDGGKNWANITPPGLPLHSTVNEIVLSPFSEARAFAVIHRYRMDDFHPYIYRTNDYGATWTLLTDGTNGIPANHPTRTLQEDPSRKGLLYAGTEFGLFVSFDDGGHWQSFQMNLPLTPVMDLQVHQNDLIVATQGRALWIMDDLTPLHQMDAAVRAADAHLFKPRAAYRLRLGGGRGGDWPENPPDGAMIFYRFAKAPTAGATIEIRDSAGALVRTFTPGGAGTKEEVFQSMRTPTVTIVGAPRVLTTPGMHRLVWDLRYPPAYLAPGVNEWGPEPRVARVTGDTKGPLAMPGTYTVTLKTADGWSESQTFDVRLDPRVNVPAADLQATFDLSIRARDRLTDIQLGVARGQVRVRELERAITAGGPAARDAARSKVELEAILSKLYKYKLRGDHADLPPELSTDYANILTLISGADAAPTANASPRMEELDLRFNDLMGRLKKLLAPIM
jgi:photosystem II stability/assembly factor-like uncharacterized protein